MRGQNEESPQKTRVPFVVLVRGDMATDFTRGRGGKGGDRDGGTTPSCRWHISMSTTVTTNNIPTTVDACRQRRVIASLNFQSTSSATTAAHRVRFCFGLTRLDTTNVIVYMFTLIFALGCLVLGCFCLVVRTIGMWGLCSRTSHPSKCSANLFFVCRS